MSAAFIFRGIFAVGLLLAAPAIFAQPKVLSKVERSILPKWCSYTQAFDPADPSASTKYDQYLRRFGVGWKHMHHYCWGLVWIMRSNRHDASKQERLYLQDKAVDEINYVLQRAPSDFVMLFQILYQKTKVLISQRNLGDALSLTDQILLKWPKRADSYGLRAEVLIEQKQTAAAKQLLDRAQELVSDQDRLTQIRKALAI